MSDQSTLLRAGLEEIRQGNFFGSAAVSTLALYAQIEGKRFRPPPVERRTEAELDIKRQVEAAIQSCTITWANFERVLRAIGDRSVMFGWFALENLPIVLQFTSKYVLQGKTLREYTAAASNFYPQTLEPIRQLFAGAAPEDRPKFSWYMQAHWGLHKLRYPHNIMVQSHCDKRPAYETLWREFEAALASA